TGDKKEDKKADEKKRDMSRIKCYNCKKEGHFAKDCKKAKVKDYEYYKTKMLLAKKDKDEQVLLAEDQAWMKSSSDFDQEINANMVFMAQIKKVLSDSEASSSQDELRRDHGWFDDADSVVIEAVRGSEYCKQDRKAAIFYEYKTFKAIEGEQLLDTYLRFLQYGTLMRQTKNLMDINIDALYNILKQNQGDVNDALGYKKKTVVVTTDPLALVAEKINVSKRKEKVVVSLDSEGSGAADSSELKKITALLGKAFNQRKCYSKPTNNNLRTSSTSQSANKKQEFVKSDDRKVEKKDDKKKRDMSKVKCYNCKNEGHFAKDCKKAKVKDHNYHKTKMLLAKKDSDEQVLLAEDQAWMESSSDYDQEINANMVFMAQIKKVLSDSDTSSSSAKETIAEVAYYTSESESESEFKTS
nr:hypothetical protein [Tanacetum cinerariifolium]